MARVIILGATGSLGRHVLRQAVAAGHDVTVFVRTPSKLLARASANGCRCTPAISARTCRLTWSEDRTR